MKQIADKAAKSSAPTNNTELFDSEVWGLGVGVGSGVVLFFAVKNAIQDKLLNLISTVSLATKICSLGKTSQRLVVAALGSVET